MMDARKAVAIFMDAPRCRRASARPERSIALFVRSIESGAPNSPMLSTMSAFWPLADISVCGAHVPFRGQSRHDLVQESAFAVAIGGEADIGCALPQWFLSR